MVLQFHVPNIWISLYYVFFDVDFENGLEIPLS